jgi:outer membrane protein assembly factor BamA
MLYDARDIRTNPTKGFFINIEAIYYDNFLSGNYKYQLFGIDYRQYLPLFRKGSIVAWQLNSTLGFGNMPWCDLQKIGTPNDLRGFFKGQYRDKSTAVLQLEYRHTFSGNNKDGLSRHGFVFWIGCGTVFEEITKIDNALFNTGLGYRFEIQPDNNLRIDLGFGTKNTGIYINYSESF